MKPYSPDELAALEMHPARAEPASAIIKAVYDGKLVENVIQSTAFDLYLALEKRFEELPARFPGAVVTRPMPDCIVIESTGGHPASEISNFLNS